MRTEPISSDIVNYRNPFKSAPALMTSETVVLTPEPVAKKRKNEKTLPIVSAAVAVASLGVASYAVLRGNSQAKNVLSEVKTSLGETVTNTVREQMGTVDSKINEAVSKSASSVEAKISGLNSRIDGINLDETVRKVNEQVNNLSNSVVNKLNEVSTKTRNIVAREVNVNGKMLTLATNLHGYGPRDAELTRTLQTESAKRILGATPLVATAAGALTMRLVTSEYAGFAKTGGLAAVPPEIIANTGAYFNDKQAIDLYVDMPLYLGPVEDNKEFRLVNKYNGKFDYVAVTDGGRKFSTLAELEEIGSFPLEIYDDYNKSTETVRMFRSNVLTSKVDFEKTLAQLRPEVAEKVKEDLAAGKTSEVGPLLFKPAVDVNRVSLKVSEKDSISVNFDGFLALFSDDAVDVVKDFMESGKTVNLSNIKDMLVSRRTRNVLENLQKQNVDPAEYQSRLEQLKDVPVQIFKDDISRNDFVEIVANKADAELLNNYMKNKKVQIPDFTIIPKSNESVVTRYRAIFYDNKRFVLDGPYDREQNKSIYDNRATNSGETERFLALSKFFYEHLMPNNQSYLKMPLNADLIIGNDWHTGGISAMMRYLTPARKAFGMSPAEADRLQNIPIVTVMHNFKLSGAVNHSQEKLLNMMFGEHTAKIVENAYAPNGANYPGYLLNTLFTGDAINPQTMAMNLSDYVPFVSVGNFNEASNQPARGGANFMLAAMRGRTGFFADQTFLRRIAAMNDINPDKISPKPTAGGITNGCDRINNIVSKEKAREVEMYLGLPSGSLMSVEDVERLNAEGKNGAYLAHQNNKKVNLKRVIDDVNLAKATNGAVNLMNLYDIENTDLTGVDENTMVIGVAGRIVDQKGLDIEAAGILEFYKSGKFDPENPPLCYVQGRGDMKYMTPFWNVKNEVAKINKKAADRMIFCNLFNEPGRYDACKMFSDFSGMPSWDEPCGLVHKEIAYASGAIPIVNKVGGLRDGLYEYGTNGENAIFVDFMDKDNNSLEDALAHNGKAFGEGIRMAQEWFNDKDRFANGIRASYYGDYDWLSGKYQQYAQIFKDKGVVSKDI